MYSSEFVAAPLLRVQHAAQSGDKFMRGVLGSIIIFLVLLAMIYLPIKAGVLKNEDRITTIAKAPLLAVFFIGVMLLILFVMALLGRR